ncbi:class I SAM-dependent methyltransferase [Tessaracoccus oleiagri]|uniref:Methyltransferase small domain-containing protein n=1 Tax=Tessaracoccus oleiagri TaxID=686624 RepID=A0A1G9KWD9_9ACTN|nr:methyltransferase [Tessaracoccus oleiagri]SDL53854.1 Methyltransferase small domain-containing protein [Tessaracoccus oleiagri]
MSHYFETGEGPLVTREITAQVFGRELGFTTARGVFSGSRLDPGTSVLLREVSPPQSGHLLDLGCGFGPIAVGLAVASPGVTVEAVDVNEKAVELTRMNAERHQVADRVSAASTAAGPFDEIWSNPPIRIGKEALHELLLAWLPRLKPDGVAWLVVGKNLGGDSLAKWLTAQGWPTEKFASAKGFRILKTTWARE